LLDRLIVEDQRRCTVVCFDSADGRRPRGVVRVLEVASA